MPFVSRAQMRACFAKKESGKGSTWNCQEWVDNTPNIDSLPEHKKDACMNAAQLGVFAAKHACSMTTKYTKKPPKRTKAAQPGAGAIPSTGGMDGSPPLMSGVHVPPPSPPLLSGVHVPQGPTPAVKPGGPPPGMAAARPLPAPQPAAMRPVGGAVPGGVGGTGAAMGRAAGAIRPFGGFRMPNYPSAAPLPR